MSSTSVKQSDAAMPYGGLYHGLEDYFLSWYLIVNLVIGVIGGLFCLIFILISRLFPINVRIWMICISLGNVGILLFDALRMEVKVLSPTGFDFRDINLLWCRVHLFFSNYFFYWSAYMQTCLSLQRLYFIWFPLKARYILRTRFIVVTLIVISLLLILPLIPYFLWHIGAADDCEPPYQNLYAVTTVLDTVIWVGIPFLLMSISTALIAYKISTRATPNPTSGSAVFSSSVICSSPGPNSKGTLTPCSSPNGMRSESFQFKESPYPKEKHPKNRVITKTSRPGSLSVGQCHGGHQDPNQITRLLVALNIFYMITTFPLLIYMLALNFYFKESEIPKQLRKFVYYLLRSLCYSNSAFNWILYFMTGTMFRDRVMKAFPCLRRIFNSFGRAKEKREQPVHQPQRQTSRQSGSHVTIPLRALTLNEDEEENDE